MRPLSVLWRMASSWYISLLFVVGVGVVIGYFVFFEVYPGKPKIGIIDIPFTVFNEDSAFTVKAFLDYARERDDIKAVVIRLTSPGSSGGAGEQLYLATREVREDKPVVIAMGDIVASGAYMMSMGANYLYANPGTAVGSVGVFIAFPFPSIPEVPDEAVMRTGPKKFLGNSRRDFTMILEQIKENFYQMVAAERGEKLRLSKEELLEAQLYFGGRGVNVGLVDAIGGDTDAIEKAASLAGISNYDLVDVNVEVFRIFNQKFVRVTEPLLEQTDGQMVVGDMRTLAPLSRDAGDEDWLLGGVTTMEVVRRSFLPSGVEQVQEELIDFPLEINAPRIYYLYVGPTK